MGSAAIKQENRRRRARRTKARIQQRGEVQLMVFRSNRHIYAQVISPGDNRVLASASTLDAGLRTSATGNVVAATRVGQLVAERALQAGLSKVVFNRNGFLYHGRVRALAEAAHEAGLQF